MVICQIRIQSRHVTAQRLSRICGTRHKGGMNTASTHFRPDSNPTQSRILIARLGLLGSGMNPCRPGLDKTRIDGGKGLA
jgi:hypothetical protein